MTSPASSNDGESHSLFGKWLVLLASIFTFGFGVGIPISLSVMFLDWQDTFNETRGHTAAVHSTCVGILFGGAVLAGTVMDRIGARKTLLIGSLMASTGLFISMFATSINYLIATMGVMGGLGFSFIQLPVFPCLTAIFTKYRTAVISLCLIATAVVSIGNRYLFRLLVELYTWRGACAIIAGITLNTCVSGMIITSVLEPTYETEPCRVCAPCGKDEKTRDEIFSNNIINDNGSVEGCYSLGDSPSSSESNLVPNNVDIETNECPDSCHEEESLVIMTNDRMNEVQIQGIEHIAVTGSPGNGPASSCRCRSKKCDFITDIVFILVITHVGLCLATIYSFCLILMDFSSTLGFDDSTGVLFLTIVFVSSIAGRMGVGIADLFLHIHSVVIQTFISLPGTFALIFLSFVQSRVMVICLLGIVGLTVGGLVSIYPKSTLDVPSVTRKSYPIALGICCTIEGITNLAFPVFIGYSVDATGSYTFILLVIACLCLASTLLLRVGFYYKNRTSPTNDIHQTAPLE